MEQRRKISIIKAKEGHNLSQQLALRWDISFLSNVCSRNFGLTRWSEPRSPVASLRTFIDKSFTIWQILIKASSTRGTSSEDGNLTILRKNSTCKSKFFLHGQWHILKHLGKFRQVHHSQSASIFINLNHLCSFLLSSPTSAKLSFSGFLRCKSYFADSRKLFYILIFSGKKKSAKLKIDPCRGLSCMVECKTIHSEDPPPYTAAFGLPRGQHSQVLVVSVLSNVLLVNILIFHQFYSIIT